MSKREMDVNVCAVFALLLVIQMRFWVALIAPYYPSLPNVLKMLFVGLTVIFICVSMHFVPRITEEARRMKPILNRNQID